MKKLVIIVIAFVLLVAGIVYLATSLTSGLLNSHEAAQEFCGGYPATHTVIIQDDAVTPDHIQAARCDRMTIINRDNKQREIAFGQHENHIAYDGVLERTLEQNQQLTVLLNKAGDYHFHDHYQDGVAGTFSVY